MERLFEDIRFGFRSLRANPTFSFIAILTLAMGIGVTTAMFTLVNSVLLKPLPFVDAHELVYVTLENKKTGELSGRTDISFVERIEKLDSPLQELAYYAYNQVTLGKGDIQTPYTVLITSQNFLSMHGVKPIIGRWYEAKDLNTQSVVISYNMWQKEFAGDPNILSRVIKLDNRDYNVLGVMPLNYSSTGFTSIEVWKPINKLDRPVQIVGRLKTGLSTEQAKQQSMAIERIVDEILGEKDSVWEIKYTTVLESIVGNSKQSLYLLLAAVLAVFLIAVLNVANLTFAQYTNRVQEFAVRVSVGASRGRLLRQLITESALFCLIGGLAGLLLAAWSLEWIRELMGSRLPRLHEISLDQTAVLAALALISISALTTALIPAYSLVNPNKLTDAIKQAGQKMTGDKNSQKVRRFMVSSEVGIAVVLLVCAGLLIRSYINLADQDTGFNTQNIVTGHVWLPDNFKPQPNRHSYWLDLVETIKNQPEVIAVAASSTMPMGMTGIDYPVNYSYQGAPVVPRGEEPTASVRSITADYFSLLEVPILAGREFDYRDTANGPKVVVINDYLAKTIWPNEVAIGKTLTLPKWMGGDHRIVGVVGNVKHRGLRAVPLPEFFLPVTQHNYPGMSLLVKTNSNANVATIKSMMLKTSIEKQATAPMILLETMQDLTEGSIVGERLILIVLSVFAGVALLLASIGVYGISDNMVSQRTSEIGIRMAIGARPALIRRWIVWNASKPVIIGAVVGVLMAFIFGQFLASVLYGVKIFDPITFAAVPLVLVFVGIIATWLPARRATRIHPQQALHYE
ncbi:ABC transporter permease [Aliikangiella marina]|uniref:ABC transporter permease n=1 Tax=Aliikangiella marina TaxID=1712262 RepID=A0A545T1I2_9GAMM|nr:ABC transporter permease [Aliikangiella marina]TQV71076.1 ABC transporter permease [Aliikangiella marina]